MIHSNLNNIYGFGQISPRYHVTDVSKNSSIYGKIGLKNNVWSIDTYAEPSLNNANPRYQNYGIGFETSININHVTIHGYIEPWDLNQDDKTKIAFGADGWMHGKLMSIGIGYDHSGVIKGRFQNTYKIMQSLNYKIFKFELFGGISTLYASKALFGAKIQTDITNTVSIFAKDSVYIGNLNKFETGINISF